MRGNAFCYFRIIFVMITAACLIMCGSPDKVKETGWLTLEGADLRGHDVIDSETEEKVGFLSSTSGTIELPVGIYAVTFGGSTWKNIEVKAGETTLLKPGGVEITAASFRGHLILEAESGKELGEVSSLASSMTLIPGDYSATFGNLKWKFSVEAGKTTTLNPGVVSLEGAGIQGHVIRTPDGGEIGSVSQTAGSMPLPPGEYTIEISGEQVPFTLEEGQRLTLENK